MLSEAVDELSVMRLLNYAARDVDALNPCASHDGRGDVGPLLFAQVTVNLVEAGNGEKFERVEVRAVLGESAEGVEVEELAYIDAVGQVFYGEEVGYDDAVLIESVDVSEVRAVSAEVEGAFEARAVVFNLLGIVEDALVEACAAVLDLSLIHISEPTRPY